ncbi:hypothetical protein MS3_00001156 [Schistosoma haematobium]|uniref:Uncharacterized protein n=1 Tax=Schistosoma haematobium TaxID=6185 RepID=A0A922LUI4_SCHHA|nr:hypothetical protein MS3_00001156 [Schistosoma haematobium]KAH9594024.1 hypothetical protein MS3_00001156 [Schistosoma haematobium]
MIISGTEQSKSRIKQKIWIYSVKISSSKLQSSKLPSGRKRRIMIGILLALNSFSAIFRGSRSPSSSTITGADIDSCRARAPKTLARSYFVRYGVVIRLLFSTGAAIF